MTAEFESKNNFERNLSSDTYQTKINQHLSQLRERRDLVNERMRAYPATYDEYMALELDNRLNAAVKIFRDDAPERRWREEALREPLSFDISSLSGIEDGSVKVTVVHSEGSWTNAVNDTYVDKHPHLNISLTTALDGKYLTEHLADLEVIDHYHEEGYKNYQFTHNTFRVVEHGWKKEYIKDPEHPLFRDVITIVDMGVGLLYQQKLAARIAHLGNAALQLDTTNQNNVS